MKPIFDLRHVSFSYGGRGELLRGVDLALGGGEATAILGRNGTGKTTLLHLALGWLKPLAGEIALNGKPLAAYSRRELGVTMSLVPQSEHVAFDYTVLEYVLLGRAPHLGPTEVPGPADRDAVETALDRVGISDLRDRRAGRLSGGELQLVLLARSLAQEPRLLFLDEPSAHLDISNKVRLLGILRQLRREGVALLFSTHDADFAAALADRVGLLDEGAIFAFGSPLETLSEANLTKLYRVPVRVRNVEDSLSVCWH